MERGEYPCKAFLLRVGKTINFLWPKMARWDPVFDPENPPEKFTWVPFLRCFIGNEAHQLFLGAQMGGFWTGAKKLTLNKFMCFLPLKTVTSLNKEFRLLKFHFPKR